MCGRLRDGRAAVMADLSAGGLRPQGWARRVAEAAEAWAADRVIAEANNGGEMVEDVLRTVEPGLPVRLVHAARGKGARAEPVAALFEARRCLFAGSFPELEDELAAMTAQGHSGRLARPRRRDGVGADRARAASARKPRVRSFVKKRSPSTALRAAPSLKSGEDRLDVRRL